MPARLRTSRPRWGVAISCALALALPTAVQASDAAGTVVRVTGDVQVGTAQSWAAAAVGTTVAEGSRLRTGAESTVRVLLADDSVIDLEQNGELLIERQRLQADPARAESELRLTNGRVLLRVSDRYREPGSSFVVTSPTARTTVPDGDFALEYNAEREVTDVASIRGQLRVHSLLDPDGDGVLITARHGTSVKRDAMPLSAQLVDLRLFEEFADPARSVGNDWQFLLWQNNQVLNGTGIDRFSTTQGLPGDGTVAAPALPKSRGSSSVDRGEDAGSLLGVSPAALSSGDLGFGVHFD